MKMQQLQARLRTYIWARIHRGELTGLALSRDAGFQQAHLSNFLNARRGLSLDSLDRLLRAMDIGLLDLIDPDEIQKRAATGQRHRLRPAKSARGRAGKRERGPHHPGADPRKP